MTVHLARPRALAVALAAAVALVAGGCASPAAEDAASSDMMAGVEESTEVAPLDAPALETITALDIDESAGEVRLATNAGVLVAPLPVTEEPVSRAEALGDRVDAVKAYQRLGTRILISGHPTDAPDDQLGIWVGDAETGEWQPLALEGEVDIHAMAAAGPAAADGIVAAADAVSNTLFFSPDGGESWQQGATIGAIALAFTADGSTLVAATPVGLKASTDRGISFSAVAEAPGLQLLATPPVGTSTWRIVGVDAVGGLWESTDGVAWEQLGTLPFVPSAIALGKGEDAVYVATPEGVSVTEDAGETLMLLVDLRG